MSRSRFLSIVLALVLPGPALLAQKEHGFDNRKPSGQPYLSPAESVKRFQVPPEYEVTVFAAEPDVVNPVAFTVDEKGRLWVVECFEYPRRTTKGKMPRDRIKVLEDTDGDGKADKVTVWAEGKDFPNGEYPTGFDLATGIEVGHGGVYLGAAPFLFHLRDREGKGKCDTHEVLLRGFGSQDTHETLNTFQWGPDGRLYGLHGVFTHSQVGEVKMNAAVWRYDGPGKRFEIFAEGTSNPWGMDFDSEGQCFLACCVIPHLFHMSPGGTYKRQAGSSFNPYAYGLLKEICDHQHHKESGWAHAGLLYLDGDHVPKGYRGSVIMGSIHGCCVKRDVLRPNGSTYIAQHASDFLVSGDKNLRPINLRWGPDGSIFLIDWHDQNPCHQAPPDSWDAKHGRVYRIQRKNAKKSEPVDLAKKSTKELVELLRHDGSPWWYRTALRLLAERRDPEATPLLRDMALKTGGNELHALRALWALYACGGFEESVGRELLKHKNPVRRLWAVRFLGEGGKVTARTAQELTALAKDDAAAEVRLQLASTAARLKETDVLPLLHELMKHKGDAKDPCLPLMIWLAYEPRLTSQRHPALEWLKEHAADNALVAETIVPRTMRRLVATGKPEDLAACVAFVGEMRDTAVRRQALAGLAEALQNRQLDAPEGWKRVFASLVADPDGEVQRLARKLAVNFRDREAIRRALAVAADKTGKADDRIDAVRDLGLAVPPEAVPVLLEIVKGGATPLRVEAVRALGGFDRPEVAEVLLAAWKEHPVTVRVEAVNVLAGRKEWARALLTAVGDKHVPRTDLTDNTILRMRAFKDKQLDDRIRAVWGQLRDTPADLAALLTRMRGQLHEKPASYERGRKVFENVCAKCHKFDGKGHDVGPALDGAARDIEYLLVNVLDPNRVIGAPYFTRLAVLKSGRVETGLLMAEDEQSVTLKAENDARKVILKKDIEELQVQEKSVMPEGLGNAMSVQDFRDLVRYVMAHPFLTHVHVTEAVGPQAVDPADPEKGRPELWARSTAGVGGRIELRGDKGSPTTRFVRAEVTAPGPMRTRLQLGSAAALTAWVNGKEVYNGRPGTTAEPDQVGADVELKPGKNVLLFRVTIPGDAEVLHARLLDPDRKLRHPEGE